jgi:hypothetical protein
MNNKMQIKGGCPPSETLKSMIGRIIAITMMFLILATTAYSATYYVNGASGNDGNPGTIGSPWQTIHKANITLVAGDTVYIRGGTADFQIYNIGQTETISEGIRPVHSGTDASHRITYAVYPGEKVHFVGNHIYSQAIHLINVDWIKITGYDGSTSAMNMKFSNMMTNLWIHDGITSPPYGVGSDYNEVSYCEFATGIPFAPYQWSYRGSTIYHNSGYNWIHHCSFYDFGGYPPDGTDAGVLLEIGWQSCGIIDAGNYGPCTDTGTHSNVIEDCIFYHGGHHTIGIMLNKNVVRNNIFHNEQWFQSPADKIWYGYRVIWMGGESNLNYIHGYNLVEGNRISHATNNFNGSMGGAGIHLSESNDVIRYNDFYANAGNDLYIESHSAATTGRVNYNHIYNNTFFATGYGATFPNATNPLGPPSTTYRSNPPDRSPIYCVADKNEFPTVYYGNAVKNNLEWKGYGGFAHAHGDNWGFGGCPGYAVCGDWVFDHNWVNADGDPKFVSEGSYGSPQINKTDVEWYWPKTPDGSDITKINTEPSFTLQSSSPAIDGGTYLTQANGTGSNSMALIVDDAKYFQPGWGNGAGGSASVQADWIAIGTVSNTVQISSINYDTKTITLVSPMTWSDNAPVWLYKNSSGQVVLRGSAPDCGAHEYVPSAVQTISLSPGWNWVSFNVLPTDLSLNSVFSGILSQIEQVKTQTHSAIRSAGNWKGDLADMSGIGQYKMYKVKVSAACTLNVTGTAVPSTTPIQLGGGWNWVAFLPTTVMPIATALASISGQVQEIKSLTQSAIYNGTTWSGTLTQLQPGQGYAIRMNASGTLTYPAVGAYKHTPFSKKE